MNNKPKVSVVMITYAHEKYIQQAIEGVFMQKTNFPVELIISNDCSPDNSDYIIKNIIKKAPENILVRYTKHERNLGMMPNFIWALNQAGGEYIALCEGDDYWTDENKLQKQVDFLESNEDTSLVFHGCKVQTEDGTTSHPEWFANLEEKNYTDVDLLHNWLIPTASVVFRATNLKKAKMRLSNKNYYFGDIVLFLSLTENGKLYCFPEKMSVYRITSNGATNKDNVYKKYTKIAQHNEMLATDFEGKYKNHFINANKNIYFTLTKYSLKKMNPQFIKYYLKYLKYI